MLEIPTPHGGSNRVKLTTKQYFQGFLGMAFFLGMLFLYGIEFKYFSNTFEVKGLVIRSLVIGAIVGFTLAFFFCKKTY